MTAQLKNAIEEASLLTEAEQDALACKMMEAMEVIIDAKWDEMFARRPDVLEKLAAEALSEHEAGLTVPMDEFCAELKASWKQKRKNSKRKNPSALTHQQ
jgi:hypothetical protein